MEIQISNIRFPITDSMAQLKTKVLQWLKLSESDIEAFRILRSSIDARKKNDIHYNYHVYLKIQAEYPHLLDLPNITLYSPPTPLSYPQWQYPHRPIVIGFGPAGMFAALYFARCHARPIIIERGSRIQQRKQEVEKFFKNRILAPNSNVQFGEGGAGAFSDGKLTTNLHNEFIGFVLEEFYKHGATEDITYVSNPHIGTDYLEKVVSNIREEIISLGGEFFFNTCFTDFNTQQDVLEISCNSGQKFYTQHLLLCLGHSARDTIRHLYQKGVQMEPKSFSMGVRVEHLQSKVNQMQYGRFAHLLPPASYKGAVHLSNRGVYTFCMCPGGMVMASASEDKTIVTNGMSVKSRNGRNANSALLVNIDPADYYKNSPTDGLSYQEFYEKAAFQIANNYTAPANLMKEFLQGTVAHSIRSVKPTYPHGITFCDFKKCLPIFVVRALKEAIPLLDKHLRGFNDDDAVLTGIETRSSSPVRILRNEKRQSNIRGIYPVGEGAGYAGGITSAAIDGLRTAMMICQKKQIS